MISSTFGGFMIGQTGLRASNKALELTGQNIANVNTYGYTRQVMNFESLNLNGFGADKIASQIGTIGSGVVITGMSQIRDPYIDKRLRDSVSEVGNLDAKLSTLNSLADTLDESTKEALQKQIKDLESRLQDLNNDPFNSNYESMVKSAADTLAGLFNNYAGQIETVKEDLLDSTDKDITKVNDLLNSIAEISKSIKKNEIYGNSSLELMDKRNTMIDELSEFMKIEIRYTDVEEFGSKHQRMDISAVGADGSRYSLIADGEAGKISHKVPAPGDADQNVHLFVQEAGKTTITDITDKLASGSFKSTLEMLNGRGSFDPNNANSPKGIKFYEEQLNTLVDTFANTLNSINKDSNGTIHALFETKDGSGKFTAKNIKISEAWKNGTVKIIPSTETNPDGSGAPPSGENNNIMNLINALTGKQTFKNDAGTTIFNGSFNDYYSEISVSLGQDIKSAQTMLDTQVATANALNSDRDNTSGVSVDDEGINIMKFTKSLNASLRYITAVDESLDTIINRMGVVGR